MPERHAVVRVYVHVEDSDAPGYYVDIEKSVELTAKSGSLTPEQFAKAIGHEAKVAAIGAARRLYNPNDPMYDGRYRK